MRTGNCSSKESNPIFYDGRNVYLRMSRGPGVALLTLPALALLLFHGAATAQGLQSVRPAGFEQRLAEARRQYFADLQGDRAAASRAQASFAALSRDFPADPVVEAYSGSLELLDAARTWAVWNKRKLANDGLAEMDQAVSRAPNNLEARFIRAASTWHLPFFYGRRKQAADDFTFIAPRAEAAAKKGTLPPELAAAALDYYGQVLIDRSDNHGAKQAFEAAVRVDGSSPGGRDALKRLGNE
jgi:hypothetical protein